MKSLKEVRIIFKFTTSILLVCAIGGVLVGCDKIGQAPSGGSDQEVKDAFDKLPLDVRAKSIMGSQAPMDFKMKKIKDMYAKEGKPVPPELMQGGGAIPQGTAPGAPGATK